MASEYSYKLTPLAEQDIDSTLAYISQTLCNKKAALDLIDKIEHAISAVCEFPYSAADCKIFLITDENIRHVPIDNYVLIYEIANDEKCVRILRFRYAKTDLSKLTL